MSYTIQTPKYHSDPNKKWNFAAFHIGLHKNMLLIITYWLARLSYSACISSHAVKSPLYQGGPSHLPAYIKVYVHDVCLPIMYLIIHDFRVHFLFIKANTNSSVHRLNTLSVYYLPSFFSFFPTFFSFFLSFFYFLSFFLSLFLSFSSHSIYLFIYLFTFAFFLLFFFLH